MSKIKYQKIIPVSESRPDNYEKSELIPIAPKLIPVPHWNQHHQWPTQSGLRYWIFHSKTNGFDKVIRRVGRRVLIDEAAFFTWVDSHQGENHE